MDHHEGYGIDIPAELQEAKQSGDTVAEPTTDEDGRSLLAAPIMLRGVPIGTLGITRPPGHRWSEDEIAHLARVFRQMALRVWEREQRLRQEVQYLRIEIDEAKKVKQVAEITETEYFQQLRKHAAEMRERAKK